MSKHEVLISVICPVYNAENYIETTVASVLSQTFESLELICVDDCSADGSFEILERLAKADPRLSVYRAEQNMGAGKARNLGLQKAKGQYITFIDADDTIEPDLYEKAFALTENGSIDEVVWGLVEEHYNGNNKLVRSKTILPEPFCCKTPCDVTRAVLRLERDTLFGYQWNSLYRASLIKEYSVCFSECIFYEDYFFNLDFISHAATVASLPFSGYHYFKRSNQSITHRFSKDYFTLSYRRVESMFTFAENNGQLDSEAYGILANKLLRYTLSALCRNNNSLSGMRGKDRKKWFLDICGMDLYEKILPQAGKQNIVFCVLRRAIMKKHSFVALAMGKILFRLRK